MSARVLLAGGPESWRATLAGWLDASFDVDVEVRPGALSALRLLPNRDFALFVVGAGADPGEVAGLDLLRFLSSHARHASIPVVFAGGTESDREEARRFGAVLLDEDAPEEHVRALARELLGLG